jgi:NADH dehydrogenase
VRLTGFPGWVAWLFIHIAFLAGYRNRAGAILTWWVALTRDVRRERAYTTREVGRVRDIYQPAEHSEQSAAPAVPPKPRAASDAPAQAPGQASPG